MTFAITFCLSLLSQSDYNVRRLFTENEYSLYDVHIEASRAVETAERMLSTGSYQVDAKVRIKTIKIVEGVATQAISVVQAVSKQSKGAEWKPFVGGYLELKARNNGPISAVYWAHGVKLRMTWLSAALSASEWVVPMPGRLLPIDGAYQSAEDFPVSSVVGGPGWPQTIPVPITYTFVGPEKQGNVWYYRLSRSCEADVKMVGTDGKGSVTGRAIGSGGFLLQAETGRLVESSLSWIMRLNVDAPAAMGGKRSVDYALTVSAKLSETGQLGTAKPQP